MKNQKTWIAAAGIIGFSGVALVLIIFKVLKMKNDK
jgi:hypothetical protein